MRDAVLFSREARLHAALRSNLNAIHIVQNELRLLLSLSDQQRRYLNSNVEQMGVHLEEMGAHRLSCVPITTTLVLSAQISRNLFMSCLAFRIDRMS